MSENSLNEDRAAENCEALAVPVERCVSVPPPAIGLTIKYRGREANIHSVVDGIVFYGIYISGTDWPARLYRISIDKWDKLVKEQVKNGAEIFSSIAH